MAKRKLPPDAERQIVKLYRTRSAEELARDFGLVSRTVRNIIVRNGGKVRTHEEAWEIRRKRAGL